MRSPLAAVLALVGMVLIDSSALAQRGRRFGRFGTTRHGWLSSLRAGKELARETGKPLMVVIRCNP